MKLIILGYHGDRNIWPQPTLQNIEFLPLAPIRTRLLPTNCLSVFDHFVGLALNKLWSINPFLRLAKPIPGYSFSKKFCNFTCHLRVIWSSPDITILTSAEKKIYFSFSDECLQEKNWTKCIPYSNIANQTNLEADWSMQLGTCIVNNNFCMLDNRLHTNLIKKKLVLISNCYC